MARKLGAVAASLALLTIVVFSVTFAGAASPTIASEETITVTAKQTNGQYSDIGPRGVSAGDVFSYRSALYQGGAKIGVENGNCGPHFPVSAHHMRFLCSAVSSDIFGRGQILSAGTFTLDVSMAALKRGKNLFASGVQGSDITFAVTGGTGDFENVRGEMHAFSSNGKEIFHLLP